MKKELFQALKKYWKDWGYKMSIRDMKGVVKDLIPVENVIVSVSEKEGLKQFIPGLIEINPEVRFLSTGGTFTEIKKLLGADYKKNLMEISEYTGFPEMEGGLVKTLHPKIHAGILGERNNPAHQEYLKSMSADYIDMVVVNLYPFQEMVRKIEAGEINPQTQKPYDFESARGNIDVGGPTMIRAAAKNFMSCAAVCDPGDYSNILRHINFCNGATSFSSRFSLAKKVFKTTASYDQTIADYLANNVIDQIREEYTFE